MPKDNQIPSEQEIRLFIQAGRLNAAAADARLAARELESAARLYAGTMVKHYKSTMAKHDAVMVARIDRMSKELEKTVETMQMSIQDRFADFLGAENSNELLDVMVQRVADTIGPVMVKAAGDSVTTTLVRRIVREEIRNMMDESNSQRRSPTASTIPAMAFPFLASAKDPDGGKSR